MKKKIIALWICAYLFAAAFAGCGSRDGGSTSMSETSEAMSASEVDLASDVKSEFSTETVEPENSIAANAEPTEGTVRFNFTVSYLIENTNGQEDHLERSALFSFDLPEEWTFEANPYQVMLHKEGNIIGQIELQPRPESITRLFSDVDAYGAATYSTKELTVSGYPAKLYILKSGAEGTKELKPSCSFYIAPDAIPDAYVLIFFLPDAGTEDELEAVASSFLINKEWAGGGMG